MNKLLSILAVVFGLMSFQSEAQLTSNQYTLGAGDLVSISVYGQEDLSMESRLTDVGVVNYPYLGEITVIGMTVSELEAYIYTGLKGDYLVEPSVSVGIKEYRPFFINGEVNKPGGYSFQPGLSIDKAAALAGGYTERASKSKIFIVREVDGEQVEIVADSNTSVLPGDIITIEQSFF